MRLLFVDNYDSFVYNLAQGFGALGAEPLVVRNDVTLEELVALRPDAVVISPGPGTPKDAGVSLDAVRHFAPTTPVLGVCLGHQVIAEAFGGMVRRAEAGPVHGKTSSVSHRGDGVFVGLPSPLVATRYHSLAVDLEVPDALEVTATAEDGTIMALRHRTLPVEGVQFHPESVLTPDGPRLLENFLVAVRRSARRRREGAPTDSTAP